MRKEKNGERTTLILVIGGLRGLTDRLLARGVCTGDVGRQTLGHGRMVSLAVVSVTHGHLRSGSR